eukprot:ctg_786.g167
MVPEQRGRPLACPTTTPDRAAAAVGAVTDPGGGGETVTSSPQWRGVVREKSPKATATGAVDVGIVGNAGEECGEAWRGSALWEGMAAAAGDGPRRARRGAGGTAWRGGAGVR